MTIQNFSQNENVAKTSGESNIFECHINVNYEIVKIQLEYVAFLTPQNRHVRESIGFMQRATRCKIEEIRFN